MPRLLGVDIPNNKRVEYALRYIYGIGPTRSKLICEECSIPEAMRASELTEEHINTQRVCPCAGREPARMPAPARAHARLSA